MRLELSETELRPIVAAVVAETLATLDARGLRDNAKLAYGEAEAAALIGVNRHQLRDARRNGQIVGVRIGKSISYTRETLVEFLAKHREVR